MDRSSILISRIDLPSSSLPYHRASKSRPGYLRRGEVLDHAQEAYGSLFLAVDCSQLCAMLHAHALQNYNDLKGDGS